MEHAQVLARIARRACHMEDLEPQERGTFMRTLIQCADLDSHQAHILLDAILADLVGSGTLRSCEFHEGLNGVVDSDNLIELLISAYPCETGEEFGKVFVDLYAVGRLRPSSSGWSYVKDNMGRSEFRAMIVKLVEESFDRLSQVPKLLANVFDSDSEEFDIAETVRMVLDTNWVGDILPSKRRQARQALADQIVRPFPFTTKFVDDYVRDALRLEPLHVDGLSQESILSDTKGVLSDDSDMESLGSLDGFVVDEDESESGSSSSSSSSDYSDPAPKKKKPVKRRKKSYSSVSDDSSSYSTS